jgi:hypothetical protein
MKLISSFLKQKSMIANFGAVMNWSNWSNIDSDTMQILPFHEIPKFTVLPSNSDIHTALRQTGQSLQKRHKHIFHD